MDLFSIIFFLGLYYLRPQEWSSIFRSIRPVQLTMILGVGALALREKKVHLKDLFRTPHDLALILFFSWVILTSGAPYTVFKQVLNLIVFYVVIVQTLNSIPRLKLMLMWWCIFILAIAGLALLSEYGFDPFGSNSLTHGVMKDRLVLNLSIFNNPNALAHSVVPVLPMLYFLTFWKRPLVIKLWASGVALIPLLCIYLTFSKGAFLCGFVTVLATLVFGRPKSVQIAILALGMGFGLGALYKLPRMTELHKAKSDEAIQGRIAAYTYGYKCVTTLWSGIGYGTWMESFYKQSRRYKIVKERRQLKGKIIVIRRRVPERFWKAAHGSYNQMGAELGFTGLALFFSMVWCNLRTLCFAKTKTPEEERIRRTLFVLLLSYLTSSWMVDFGYRPTFFIFTAGIAAFHRHLAGIHRRLDEEAEKEAQEAIPLWKRPKLAALGQGAADLPLAAILPPSPKEIGPGERAGNKMAPVLETAPAVIPSPLIPLPGYPNSRSDESVTRLKFKPVGVSANDLLEEGPTSGTINWNRFGMIEIIMPIAITLVAIKFWAYILNTM